MDHALSSLLVFPGLGAVKSVTDEGDVLRLAGRLVKFSAPTDPDLSGDFFTAETDFGYDLDKGPVTLPAFWDHGMDETFGKSRIGTATLTQDEEGIWAEYQITKRREYVRRYMAEAAKSGDGIGQSSGAVGHIVGRAAKGRAQHLTHWLLGEASLTPTPCEPRTYAAAKAMTLGTLPVVDNVDATLKALRDFRESLQLASALRSVRLSL